MDCDWITQASPSALGPGTCLCATNDHITALQPCICLSGDHQQSSVDTYLPSTIHYLHSFAKLQTKSSFQKMWRSNQFNTSSPFIFVNIGLVFRTSFWLREAIVGKEKQDAKYKFLNVCVCFKFRGQNSLLLLHKM